MKKDVARGTDVDAADSEARKGQKTGLETNEMTTAPPPRSNSPSVLEGPGEENILPGEDICVIVEFLDLNPTDQLL